MEDESHSAQPESRLALLLSNPLRLRRLALTAAAVATSISAIAWGVLDLPGRSLILALCWIALLPIAVALGIADGFFIEHGRGLRRVLLTIISGTFVTLLSCIFLAVIDETASAGARIIGALAYALCYAAILLSLGGILGIAIGRGGGYLARRIQQVDDDGW